MLSRRPISVLPSQPAQRTTHLGQLSYKATTRRALSHQPQKLASTR